MDNFFFFIHVPKAAGITFRTIMKRNFRRQHRDFAADFYEDAISAETISLRFKARKRITSRIESPIYR